jgi:polyisoprenoid-binding protein YceI
MTSPGRRHARALLAALAMLLLVGGPRPSASGPGILAAARPAAAQGGAARYAVVPDESEVRYRVREQLAGLSFPNDAVGATRAVEGVVGIDGQGRVAPGARLVVDVRTLRSDEGRRDSYVRRNTLETDRYPTVTFVPLEVRGLPPSLPERGTASLELVGDLTIRDVTRRVTWAATATFAGPSLTLSARTAFRFGDFALRVPRVSVVLSVEDEIRLEADLTLRRGA